MRITNRGRYALRAAVALARSGNRESPVSITALAEQEGISPVFLEQIFFKLRKAGIVAAVRGPRGGFYFDKALDSLSLRNILEAAGETTELTFCKKNEKGCSRTGHCLVHPFLAEINTLVNDYLDKITLEAVLARGDKKAVPEAS